MKLSCPLLLLVLELVLHPQYICSSSVSRKLSAASQWQNIDQLQNSPLDRKGFPLKSSYNNQYNETTINNTSIAKVPRHDYGRKIEARRQSYIQNNFTSPRHRDSRLQSGISSRHGDFRLSRHGDSRLSRHGDSRLSRHENSRSSRQFPSSRHGDSRSSRHKNPRLQSSRIHQRRRHRHAGVSRNRRRGRKRQTILPNHRRANDHSRHHRSRYQSNVSHPHRYIGQNNRREQHQSNEERQRNTADSANIEEYSQHNNAPANTNSSNRDRRRFSFQYPSPQPLYPMFQVHPYNSRVDYGRANNDPNYHPIPALQLPQLFHTISQLHPAPQVVNIYNPTNDQNNVNSVDQWNNVSPINTSVNHNNIHNTNNHNNIHNPNNHNNIRNPNNHNSIHNTNRQETHTNIVTEVQQELSAYDECEQCSTLKGADHLKVGKALNIFTRYGFLTLSIKVRPPVGEDNFLFLEKTADIFQRSSYYGQREIRRHKGNYDDHFNIHFCKNVHELLVAYFDHFIIEGVPEPHKAFTSSLSVRDLARQFGINSSFLGSGFKFVMVRLFRRKMRSTLTGAPVLQAQVRKNLEAVTLGSTESVHQFCDRYGSHVITEVEIGDMMYQTFVFGDRIFKEIKKKFATVQSGENQLSELEQYFDPYYATSVGQVLLASGNSEFSRIRAKPPSSPEQLVYQNIFKLFDNPETEKELEKLDGAVVLSLKMDKITSRMSPPSAQRRWMSEVLDNALSVYYQHMSSTRKKS